MPAGRYVASSKTSEAKNSIGAIARCSGLPGEVHIPLSALFLACPAGPNIDWVCTYRSIAPVSSGHGPGWDFSYNISIEMISAEQVAVRDGQGRRDIFHRQPDNSFRCDGMFREGRFDGETFTLTFADTGKWVFRPLNSSVAPGKIATITDRNDVSLTCAYDGVGKLSSVSSQFGQSISVAYTGDRISGLTDHSGRSVAFSYYGASDPGGSEGDLLSISSPQDSGQPPAAGPVTFTYSKGSLDPRLNGNLLSATDGAGRTLGIFTYSAETNPLHIDFDTCASAERYKTGHVSLIKRQLRPGGGYTIFEVDEIGRVTEIDIDRLHRMTACRQYTGFSTPNVPVTSTENRPTGKLRPTTDPDFFETTYSYNSDSLCTSITRPDGSKEITIHDRDFRKICPPLEAGNPRVMTLRTPTGEERTVTCDYLPGFGTLEPDCDGPIHFPCTGKRMHKPLVIDSAYLTSPIEIHGKLYNPTWTRLASALGKITTRSFDEDGNLLSVSSPVAGRGSLFEYNTLGQLTSATTLNGPGSSFTDAISYDGSTAFLSSVICDSGGLNLTTTYMRDTLGRATRVIDPRSNDELFSYNAVDQIVEIQSAPVPERVKTSLHYDAAGQLARCDVEHRDSSGVLVSANPAYSGFFVYDDHGLLIRTAEEERPVDGSGTLDPATLGIENFAVCDISYNNAGESTRLSTPAACRAQASNLVCDFSYDERGFLHLTHEGGEGNPDGLVTARDYNLFGAIPQRRTVSGQGITTVESYTYDGFHRLSSETDPMGNVCTYEYDNKGYVTCSVYGEVNDVPGSAGNVLLSRTVSKFEPTVYSKFFKPYDGAGEVIGAHVSNPMGMMPHVRSSSTSGLLLPAVQKREKSQGAGGAGPHVRLLLPSVPKLRDSAARIYGKGCGGPRSSAFFCVETEDETITCDRFMPGGPITQEVTTIDRSPAGLVQQISCNSDVLATFSYDSAGRLTGQVSGDTSHFFTLNPNGDVTASSRTDTCPSDAAQTKTFTRSFVLDAAGRCVQTTAGTGNVSSCAYDSLDRPVSFTEAGGLVTRFAYDGSSAAGPFSEQISADAVTPGSFVVLSSSLVRSGELRSTTDSYGHTTAFSSDALGRMTRCDYPDGTFETRGHAHVNLGPIKHVDHGRTTITYDLNGRPLTSLSTSDPLVAPVSSTPLRTFTYNGLGHCTSVSQGAHVVACSFDSLGNVLTETQDGRTVTSSYTHRGRDTVTYPTGQTFVENRDALGQLLSVSALNAGTPVSPPVVLNQYAGQRTISSTQSNGIITLYQYRGDGEAQLPGPADFSFDACVKVSVSDLSITTIRRDRNQELLSKQMAFAPGADAPTRNQSFIRNRLHHVTACTTRVREVSGGPFAFSEVSYVLDLEGRRLSSSGGVNPGAYTQSSTLPPGDQQMGQYTTWPRGGLQWDDNGNLISMATATGALSFVHNVEGQLTSVSRNGVSIISYDYDPIGRCISRDPEVGTATTFFYDGDVCIQELGEDGLPDLTHVYADGIHQSIFTRGGSTFYPHASGRSRDKGQTWEFYPRANSVCVTGATGAVVERYDCDDAGKPIFLNPAGLPTGAMQSTIPLRWMTPECSWEPEIGLFHCPGGCYSPDLGTAVSASKIKIGPPRSGHEYVGHVSLIK